MNLYLPIIIEDVEITWRTFNQIVDEKEYSINVLLATFKNAKDQRQRGNIMHFTQIVHLLNIQKKQLQKNQIYYETSIQYVFNLVYDQIDVIQQEQKQKEKFLKIAIFIKYQGMKESIESIKIKNLSKVNTQKEENENLHKLTEIILRRYSHKFLERLRKILNNHELIT
ncbi:PREDICTED: uncharacterized protein LOC105366797 [Ceratosolen solmsi marchali]|uniref:Uncharacterized protein LOC105366797 n=1 Tax=Ceratosolen solmsi marchali TaxID=326594 RepID=A0AAJ6YSY6_9HYME|nr:PREDICTED: uncharacterized protein LOC105366797 [Ceratosolen solmsi marchali]